MPKSLFILRRMAMALVVVAAANLCASETALMDPPTKGLVAYYPFNGNAEDASGGGNHALVTGAMLTDDKFGNTSSALSFNGIGDHMMAPICISPSVMPSITIVVWARADQKDRMVTLVSNDVERLNGRALSMRPSPGKGVCWATSTNTGGSWVWQQVEVGKWTFLALSYDQESKKIRFYVDGNKYERDCSQIDGSIDLSIGKHPRGGQYFQGVLDELRVYDRILNDKEIAALYHQFQNGNQVDRDMASMPNDGRRGLLLVFITGFCLFAGIVLVANIMIRKRSFPA